MSGCCVAGPTIANVEWRVGETWRMRATMHDSLGAVLNISAAQVHWRLALNGVVIKELTIGAGIELVDGGVNGVCFITVTPAMQEVLGIISTYYTHECQVVLTDGTVTDQFAGNLVTLPSLFPVGGPP